MDLKTRWSARRAALLCLALPGISLAQAELQFPLPQGVFRFEGRCIEFRDSIADLLRLCKGSLGIVTQDQAAPSFLFLTTDGKAWEFQSKGKKKISKDGNHAEYHLRHFTDLMLGQAHDFGGECVVDLDGSRLRIECRARMGRKVVRTAIFESDGTFSFARDTGIAPAVEPKSQ